MTANREKPEIGVIAAGGDCAESCAAAVERSGGSPRLLAPETPPEAALARIAGLLVSCDEGTALLRAAMEADTPVLCIGLGMHALNLAMGGTLTGSIAGHGCVEEDGARVSSYHRIFIAPGSKLAATVGSGGIVRVNSRHDEGVAESQRSPSLMASAYSLEDGVIEGLESPHHRWVVGVQFQPARRNELPPHFERLFGSLVERASGLAHTTK